MGAYENPPIIRDMSGQILAKGFEDFSKSMASAIDALGERKRKEAKEGLAKEDDLLKNEMKFRLDAVKNGDDWYKIASSKNVSMAEGFRPIVMENLRTTADAKLALLTEKDSSKRQELYDLISKNETDLSSLGTMFETVYTDLAEKKSMDMTEGLGKTVMYTGDTLEEQENNQYGIAALEGKLDKEQFKISYDMDPEFGYVMNIVGTGEKTFKTSIKSRQVAAGKGLIIDMEDTVKAGTDKVISEITGGTKELSSNLFKDEQDVEYTAYKTNEKGKEIAYGKTLERRKYIKMDEIDEAIRINAEAKVASFDDLSPSVQKAIFKYQLGQTGSFEDFISNSKGNAEKYKEDLTNLYKESIKKEIEKSLEAGKKGFEKDENGNYYQVVKSTTTAFEKGSGGGGLELSKGVQEEIILSKKVAENALAFSNIVDIKITPGQTEEKTAAIVNKLNSINPTKYGDYITRGEYYNAWLEMNDLDDSQEARNKFIRKHPRNEQIFLYIPDEKDARPLDIDINNKENLFELYLYNSNLSDKARKYFISNYNNYIGTTNKNQNTTPTKKATNINTAKYN